MKSKGSKKRKQILNDINDLRLYKGLVLPFELIGIDRKQSINTYHNNRESSLVEWNHM